MISLRQYSRFLMTGTVVGLITVASRELIAVALGQDTPASYGASVIFAYALGIVISFAVNRRFTFGQRGRADWSWLPRFATIAMLGLVATAVLSIAIRYGLPLDRWLGSWAAPSAFGVAALCASALTYPLTAVCVFARASVDPAQRASRGSPWSVQAGR